MTSNSSKIEAHNKNQRDYYESRSKRENWRMQPASSPYVSNHVQKFVEFATIEPFDKILDVGCGMGKFTIPLARLGHDIEGLDLSPKLLGELVICNDSSIEVNTHHADILSPPDNLKGRYEVVTGFFMLHHLSDINASFRSMRSLLKKEGRVVFLDVNPFCFLYYLQIFLSPSMRWKAEKGMLNLTKNKISKGLSKAGFHSIEIKRYGILPPPLRNRAPGQKLESLFDKAKVFEPISAFQLISATRVD